MKLGHHNPQPWSKHPLTLPRQEGLWLRCIGEPSDRMDGDTAHLTIQGRPRHILTTESVRMDGYDAPELWGASRDPVRGPAARDALAALVVGRYGVVYLQDGIMTVNRFPGRLFSYVGGEWVDVSRLMHDMGHVKDFGAPPPSHIEFPFAGAPK